MTVKTCETCKYFVEFTAVKNNAGQCRRRSPYPVVSRFVSRETLASGNSPAQPYLDGIVDGYFPATTASLWCGEHEYASVDGDLDKTH